MQQFIDSVIIFLICKFHNNGKVPWLESVRGTLIYRFLFVCILFFVFSLFCGTGDNIGGSILLLDI